MKAKKWLPLNKAKIKFRIFLTLFYLLLEEVQILKVWISIKLESKQPKTVKLSVKMMTLLMLKMSMLLAMLCKEDCN